MVASDFTLQTDASLKGWGAVYQSASTKGTWSPTEANLHIEIYLFASRLSNQLSWYVSWHLDPNIFPSEAFTLDWSNFTFYAFTPLV